MAGQGADALEDHLYEAFVIECDISDCDAKESGIADTAGEAAVRFARKGWIVDADDDVLCPDCANTAALIAQQEAQKQTALSL